MKHHVAILISVCALLTSCIDEPIPAAEVQAYESALRLQERGDYDEARDAWRALRAQARDHRVRAKVDLGLAQVETALLRRDRAIDRLLDAAALGNSVPMSTLEQEITAIEVEFRGTPFERLIEDRAVAARQSLKQRRDERQAHEMDVVATLLESQEFSAALAQLRVVELGRTGTKNDDIVAALLDVRARAESAADQVLAEFQERRADGPAALSWLDSQLPRFLGTRAYARLFAAHLAAASETPDQPKSTKGGF